MVIYLQLHKHDTVIQQYIQLPPPPLQTSCISIQCKMDRTNSDLKDFITIFRDFFTILKIFYIILSYFFGNVYQNLFPIGFFELYIHLMEKKNCKTYWLHYTSIINPLSVQWNVFLCIHVFDNTNVLVCKIKALTCMYHDLMI